MLRRTLLLNNNYEVLAFIVERRAIKLLLRGNVDVLANWDDSFRYLKNEVPYPAILRIKYMIKKPKRDLSFSRRAVFKRDNFTCQYCGVLQSTSDITMDHVVPRMHGGGTSFLNCVAACYPCNNRKGGRTPKEAGMKLIQEPYVPNLSLLQRLDNIMVWHEDWGFYLKH